MCEFCTKHGDGKIWFKNAENYAKDLLSDLERRKYIRDFFQETIGQGIGQIGRLENIYRKKGRIPARVSDQMVAQAKVDHFGQVVTMEDITEIISGAATVVRLPCACRWAAEKKDARCCYSVSYSPDYWYEDLDMSYFGLADDEGLETVTKEEAIQQMKELEEGGAVHTIWTMKTPFIGAICNCTPEECLGLRTLSVDVETMFKGEEYGVINSQLCCGCGNCETACHFDAISSTQVDGEFKAVISMEQCFGCGICRNSCPENAISMLMRP